jgi:RNA-directed DNA polymerase
VTTPKQLLPTQPSLHTVNSVSASVGYSYQRLCALAATVPRTGYVQFASSKGNKTRVISEPTRWLRDVQRRLVDGVFASIPVADCVYSQRGRSVVLNARQHLSRDYMVVLDIRDCFPSISHRMVKEALSRLGFSADVGGVITRLVTYKGRLPLGPPTSPAIMNFVLAVVDSELTALAGEYNATYTRYGDDLCFSADAHLGSLRRRATRVLRAHGFALNAGKTQTWGPDDRHTITNIVVSSSLHPEPEYIDSLCAALRDYRNSSRSLSAASLQGKINWVMRLNPAEGARLRNEFRLTATRTIRPRRKVARGYPVRNSAARE